jgi:hypothetical protein
VSRKSEHMIAARQDCVILSPQAKNLGSPQHGLGRAEMLRFAQHDTEVGRHTRGDFDVAATGGA